MIRQLFGEDKPVGRGDLQIQDLRVIVLLSNARRALTTKEIADKLSLELRTVQRIIKAIEAIPLPLKRDPAGMGGGIRLLPDAALRVSLPSNLVELAAVHVARDKLRESASETMLGEAFDQFAERLLGQLKGEQREICDRFVKLYRTKPVSQPPPISPLARVVHKALDERRVLTIVYEAPKERTKRSIEPLGMWVADHRTYLVARDRRKNALRTFALDRMQEAEATDERFEPPSDFDPAHYFEHALSAFVGDGPIPLEITLDDVALKRLGGKLPSNAVLKKNTLHWNAPLSDELIAWMVTLGPGVTVRAPKEAVAFVKRAFTERLAAHQ